MRYFIVSVDHFSAIVREVEKDNNQSSWVCRVNGETFSYRIEKASKSHIKNWYERGTFEVQYHAKSESKGGFVLWDKALKNPAQLTKSKKAAQEKMRKLL